MELNLRTKQVPFQFHIRDCLAGPQRYYLSFQGWIPLFDLLFVRIGIFHISGKVVINYRSWFTWLFSDSNINEFCLRDEMISALQKQLTLEVTVLLPQRILISIVFKLAFFLKLVCLAGFLINGVNNFLWVSNVFIFENNALPLKVCRMP